MAVALTDVVIESDVIELDIEKKNLSDVIPAMKSYQLVSLHLFLDFYFFCWNNQSEKRNGNYQIQSSVIVG